MKISKEKPACWDKIAAAFPITWESGIIVTYAGVVHCSSGHITDDIAVHEAVHIRQQRDMDPDEYVDRFIADPKFRFDVELEAFRAQAAYIRAMENNERRANDVIEGMARHLSSEKYGSIISYEEAKKLL